MRTLERDIFYACDSGMEGISVVVLSVCVCLSVTIVYHHHTCCLSHFCLKQGIIIGFFVVFLRFFCVSFAEMLCSRGLALFAGCFPVIPRWTGDSIACIKSIDVMFMVGGFVTTAHENVLSYCVQKLKNA